MSTKEKILQAAKKLFIQYGFAGTSIGKIAEEAGINHSLIFHHYKNKKNLWLSVKQNMVVEAQQDKRMPSLSLPFQNFLKELFYININFYRENPDLIRMLNWQRLEYDTNEEIGITINSETQRWIDAFASYQKKGDISKNFKMEYIVSMVLAIMSSTSLDPNVFIDTKEKENDYINFIIELIVKALKTP